MENGYWLGARHFRFRSPMPLRMSREKHSHSVERGCDTNRANTSRVLSFYWLLRWVSAYIPFWLVNVTSNTLFALFACSPRRNYSTNLKVHDSTSTTRASLQTSASRHHTSQVRELVSPAFPSHWSAASTASLHHLREKVCLLLASSSDFQIRSQIACTSHV